jgi:hypothetical protein
MRILVDKYELLRVLEFVGKTRGDIIAHKIHRLGIISASASGIKFGLPSVMGTLSISWDFFFEQQAKMYQDLDREKNER